MIVHPLPWDSEFFGRSVGSLVAPATIVPDHLFEFVESCEFDVIYIKIEDPTPDQLDHFATLAPLADHKIVYEKSIFEESIDLKAPVQPYEGGITDALVEMAWESGLYSRFHLDPRFQPHYRRLYRTWLTKSIDGELADVVFVSVGDDVQVGFVTASAKGSVGEIGLLAVASQHRRHGIAGQLLQKVEAWCKHADLERVRVVTQQRNTGACRMYERYGYRIAKTIGIYHYWRSKTE